MRRGGRAESGMVENFKGQEAWPAEYSQAAQWEVAGGDTEALPDKFTPQARHAASLYSGVKFAIMWPPAALEPSKAASSNSLPRSPLP